MKFIVPILSTIFLLSSCGKQNDVSTANELILKQSSAIYGKDDRKDVFQIKDPTILNLAKYVGVSISKKNLRHKKNKKVYHVNYVTLEEEDRNFCKDEFINFKKQVNPGSCTGFLLSEKIYITMAHCLTSDYMSSNETEKIRKIDITKRKIVFNYFQHSDGSKIIIPEKNVYSVKKILELNHRLGFSDYAILELDRPFPEKVDMPLERVVKSKIGDRLVMIGAPLGLPIKVTDNGTIISEIDDGRYGSDLDAFSGNSGSLVYNLDTQEIIGLLERGNLDYVEDTEKKCRRVNVQKELPPFSRGEIIEKISKVFETSKLENLPR